MKRPCVICDDAYRTRYICDACKADPANDGWKEEKLGTKSDEYIDQIQPENRLPDLIDPKPKGEKPRVKTALDLLRTGMSYAQVARIIGCSRSYVEYLFRTRVNGMPKIANRRSMVSERRSLAGRKGMGIRWYNKRRGR